MKYKKTITLMAAFTTFIILGAISLANANLLSGLAPFEGVQFSKVDRNNDAQISETELINYAKKQFLSADANNDGVVSSDELIASRTAKVSFRTKKIVKMLDKNSNGFLEFEEIHSKALRRFEISFDNLDLNNDGHLNEAEFSILTEKSD
jgi:Ca2+-binding EF-hand superfamily protein